MPDSYLKSLISTIIYVISEIIKLYSLDSKRSQELDLDFSKRMKLALMPFDITEENGYTIDLQKYFKDTKYNPKICLNSDFDITHIQLTDHNILSDENQYEFEAIYSIYFDYCIHHSFYHSLGHDIYVTLINIDTSNVMYKLLIRLVENFYIVKESIWHMDLFNTIRPYFNTNKELCKQIHTNYANKSRYKFNLNYLKIYPQNYQDAYHVIYTFVNKICIAESIIDTYEYQLIKETYSKHMIIDTFSAADIITQIIFILGIMEDITHLKPLSCTNYDTGTKTTNKELINQWRYTLRTGYPMIIELFDIFKNTEHDALLNEYRKQITQIDGYEKIHMGH